MASNMASAPAGDRSGTVNGFAIAMIVLTVVTITLRIASRLTSQKIRLWWDDWAAILAVPFLIVLNALTIHWVSVGLGKPIRESTSTPGKIMVVLFVSDLFYNTGLTLVKYSALLFYARCFKAVTPFRIALYVGFGLVTAWYITFQFMAIFSCVPVQKAWEMKEPGHCLPTVRTFYGTTLTNVFIDLYILIMPLPLLWKLQASSGRKVALFLIFILGYCVIVVSIARLVTSVDIGTIKDPTWQLAVPDILLNVEPAVALVSVSLPAMYDIVKRVTTDMPSVFSRVGLASSRKTSEKTSRSDDAKLTDESSPSRSTYSR